MTNNSTDIVQSSLSMIEFIWLCCIGVIGLVFVFTVMWALTNWLVDTDE